MWETLDTCYERPGKYAEEALKPIVDFRRYSIGQKKSAMAKKWFGFSAIFSSALQCCF
jgi:hypothetical protein